VYCRASGAGCEGHAPRKGDIRTQALQVFQNLRQVLHAAGGDPSDLLKMTTYLTRIEDSRQ